jgi:hypothetical protein
MTLFEIHPEFEMKDQGKGQTGDGLNLLGLGLFPFWI